MPQPCKNGVVCSAGALLGAQNAMRAMIFIVVLALQRWFCSWCYVCCESTESAGTSIVKQIPGTGQSFAEERSKQSQIVSLRVVKHATRIDGPVALVFVRASRCGAEDGVYN